MPIQQARHPRVKSKKIKPTGYPPLACACAPEYLAGVNRAVSRPGLDGKGNAECWHGIPALWFGRMAGDPAESGFIKLLWDDRALYVFVWSEAEDMAKRKKEAGSSPASVFYDDECELFIDPGCSREYYYHLATDAAGGLYQAAVKEVTLPDTSWKSGATIAVARSRNAWSVEADIPFASLGMVPQVDDTWGFNAGRMNLVASETSSWRLVTPFHRPKQFGRIRFLDTSCLAKARREQAEAARREMTEGRRRARRVNAMLQSIRRETVPGYLRSRCADLKRRAEAYLRASAGANDFIGAHLQCVKAPPLLAELNALQAGIKQVNTLFKAMPSKVSRRYAVCVESPMNKVSATKYYGSPATAVKLSLAGREYGSFQLAMLSNRGEHPFTGLTVRMSALADGQGKALDGARIDTYLVDPIRTTSRRAPEMVPDVLRPGQSFAFAPRAVAAVWCDVYLPAGAPAGSYHAAITLAPESAPEMTIPVAVTALPFSLPAKSSLATAFCFFDYWAEGYYGRKMPRAKMHQYIQFIIDHRLEPMNLWPHGKLEMNTVDLEWAARHGKQMLFLKIENLKKLESLYHRVIGRFRGRLKPIFFGHDEVLDQRGGLGLPAMKADYALARRRFPDVARMNTCHIDKRLYGYVNLWCPGFQRFDPRLAAQRRARGEAVWWYTAFGTHPYPGIDLKSPGIHPRIIPWMNWKFGITGLLYWALNREWPTNYQEAERITEREREAHGLDWLTPAVRDKIKKGLRWPAVPWMPFLRSLINEDGGALSHTEGGGNLMYPGPDWKPWPSCRLKNLRDGLQDYEYFVILKKNVGLLKKRGGSRTLIARAENMLKVDNRVVESAASYSKDPDVLRKTKQALAELVAQTQNELARKK